MFSCSTEELNGVSLQQLESCLPNNNQQQQQQQQQSFQQQMQTCLNRQQCPGGVGTNGRASSNRGRKKRQVPFGGFKKRQVPFGGFGGGAQSYSGLEYTMAGFQTCMHNCLQKENENNRNNGNNGGDAKQQQMQRLEDYQRMNWQEKWTVWYLYLYGSGPDVEMQNCAFDLQ